MKSKSFTISMLTAAGISLQAACYASPQQPIFHMQSATIQHSLHMSSAAPSASTQASTSPSNAMSTINAFLAGLAMHNGMVAPTPQYAQALANANTAAAGGNAPHPPTAQQAIAAMHSLPAPVHYSAATHTVDPTPAEMPFVLPGATDAAGNPLAEPTPGLIFGTITQADETITGLFDDLANLSQSNDPTASGSGASSTTGGTGAVQQDPSDAALDALLAQNVNAQRVSLVHHIELPVQTSAAFGAATASKLSNMLQAGTSTKVNEVLHSATSSLSAVAYAEPIMNSQEHAGSVSTEDDGLIVDSAEGIDE